MKVFSTSRLLLAAAIAVTGAVQAQDKTTVPAADLAKGQQIAAQVCAACHGADGNSVIAANPKLAGQHHEYLRKQLNDYVPRSAGAKPMRENAVMAGFSAQLSDADRRNVAAYYAAQKIKLGAARNKDTLELGQRIYRAGIPEKAVPACAGCHGPTGAGIPAQYPRLGGQHAEYTESQLKAFMEGTRRNNEAMQRIAARLSAAEIKAVSDYIAGVR